MTTLDDLKKCRNGMTTFSRPEFDKRLSAFVADNDKALQEKDSIIKALADALEQVATQRFEKWCWCSGPHYAGVHAIEPHAPDSCEAEDCQLARASLRLAGRLP